jgi:cytochrome c-type biogenesis protein CcmF
MGEPIDGDRWVVRVHLKPFVNWIWLGCVFMSVGGFLAIADRRYRRVKSRAAEPVATGGAQPARS